MKHAVSLVGTGLLTIGLATVGMGNQPGPDVITLKSNQVTEGQPFRPQQIYNQMGCTGNNISPELRWSNVPPGTRSLAVTMYDPDAPTDSGWWHWMVVNIPGDIKKLSLDSGMEGGKNLPKGAAMLKNDYGFRSYGGACPPPYSMPHNYQITVYALDIPNLDLNDNATPAMASFYIRQHTLSKAVLTAPTKTRQ